MTHSAVRGRLCPLAPSVWSVNWACRIARAHPARWPRSCILCALFLVIAVGNANSNSFRLRLCTASQQVMRVLFLHNALTRVCWCACVVYVSCSEVSLMPSTVMGSCKIIIRGGSDVTNQTCLYPGVNVMPGACLGVFTYAEAERTFPRDSIVQVCVARTFNPLVHHSRMAAALQNLPTDLSWLTSRHLCQNNQSA
jgi:hypothetical protein